MDLRPFPKQRKLRLNLGEIGERLESSLALCPILAIG